MEPVLRSCLIFFFVKLCLPCWCTMKVQPCSEAPQRSTAKNKLVQKQRGYWKLEALQWLKTGLCRETYSGQAWILISVILLTFAGCFPSVNELLFFQMQNGDNTNRHIPPHMIVLRIRVNSEFILCMCKCAKNVARTMNVIAGSYHCPVCPCSVPLCCWLLQRAGDYPCARQLLGSPEDPSLPGILTFGNILPWTVGWTELTEDGKRDVCHFCE